MLRGPDRPHCGVWLCVLCWREREADGVEQFERLLDEEVGEHDIWHNRVGTRDVRDCSWCHPVPPPKPFTGLVIDGEAFDDRPDSW